MLVTMAPMGTSDRQVFAASWHLWVSHDWMDLALTHMWTQTYKYRARPVIPVTETVRNEGLAYSIQYTVPDFLFLSSCCLLSVLLPSIWIFILVKFERHIFLVRFRHSKWLLKGKKPELPIFQTNENDHKKPPFFTTAGSSRWKQLYGTQPEQKAH